MPENELNINHGEYDINPNTIRYHSSAKRFFRAFTPKIVGTSSLFVTAGVGLATVIGGVFTGGVLPIVVGTVSGVTAAASAAATVSLGVDAATVSRTRYKNAGVEGAIDIVEKMEGEAYYYVQKLNELKQSKEKTIQLKDGRYYNKRQLKSLIASYEKEAYQGVKYLMAQAEKNTKQLEDYGKASKLSDSQIDDKKKKWDELGAIGKCVRNITSKRNDVNPYKNVIINALHKGCLIGRDDNENNEIRRHKNYKNFSLTEELYHNMYEKDLLKRNPPKQETVKVDENSTKPEEAQETKRVDNSIELKKQIEELESKNKKLEEQYKRTQSRYESSVKRAVGKRAENLENKRFIQEIVEKLGSVEEENEILEGQVEESARESLKYQSRYENSVKRGLNARNARNEQAKLAEDMFNYSVDLENKKEAAEKEFAKKIAELQNDQDRLLKTLAETNGELQVALDSGKEKDKKTQETFEKGVQLELEIEKINKQLANEKEKHARATKHMASQVRKTKDAEEKIEIAQDVAYDESQRAAIAEKKLEQKDQEIEIAQDIAYDESQRAENFSKMANVAMQSAMTAEAKRKQAVKNASSEKSERKKAEQQLAEAQEYNISLLEGQSENIERIIGLEVDNSKLEQQAKYWEQRAEDAEDTVKAVYGTSEALEQSIIKIQKELESISNDKVKNLEKAHTARQIKALANSIADVWNHVKIAQAEDEELDRSKYTETTSRMIDKLNEVVEQYEELKESGNIEEIKRVRDGLLGEYKVQRNTDKEHKWPPYIKDRKKVIPGTPVPDSPQDETYYVK